MKKYYQIILCLLISNCSSATIFIAKHHTAPKPMPINNISKKGDYALYKSGSIQRYLEILDNNSDEIVLKMENQQVSFLDKATSSFGGVNTLSFEYHYNQKMEITKVYIVDSNINKYEIKDISQKSYENNLIIKDSDYIITTKAGTFNCILIISKINNQYVVSFTDQKIFSYLIKLFTLDENEFQKFIKSDKKSKAEFSPNGMIELIEYGTK